MKTLKRSLSLAAVALLCAALLAPTALAQDSAPPELDLVTVYAQTVPPDCAITVGADVWDADGVELATLRFSHASGYSLGLTLTNTMGYGTADERYSGKLTIPADAPEGDYLLSFSSLTDTAANRARYYATADDMPNSPNVFVLEQRPGFTVKKGASPPTEDTKIRTKYNDNTPPTLSSVSVSYSEVVGGVSRYLLRVEAADPAGSAQSSGISNIILRFQNDKNGRTLSKVISGDEGKDGVYTGWLEAGVYEPAGNFSLYQVTVTDRAFHRTAYCRPANVGDSKKLPLPAVVGFAVANGNTILDETPPTLRGVTLAQPTIAVGDSLDICADATDDLSGVDNVNLQFKSDSGKSISVLLQLHSSQPTGKVSSFQSGKPGRYTLVKATVTDHAGNRRSYYTNPPKNAARLTLAASFTITERS
ncbi:MAG: hypothetical protein RR022_03040 [Angelakisella sp.]